MLKREALAIFIPAKKLQKQLWPNNCSLDIVANTTTTT
jgi:hypothetical protein